MRFSDSQYRLFQLIGVTVLLTVLVMTLVASLVMAADLYMILFLAFLYGIFLYECGQHVSAWTGLPKGSASGLVALIVVLIAASGVFFFGMQVEDQLKQAQQEWDHATEQIRNIAERRPALKSALATVPFASKLGLAVPKEVSGERENGSQKQDESDDQKDAERLGGIPPISKAASNVASVLGRMFTTTLGLLANSMLIFFVGLFLAVSPLKYHEGMLRLFPKERRERVDQIARKVYKTLWKWLVGRFATMLITGFGATVVLLIAGVPMAVVLGVVTGLLTFIPNIGAFFAATLMVLFSIPQGGTAIVITIVGYLVLQLVESYVLTPLIQQRQVEIAPATLLSFQALMSVLLGFLGAAVASPLLAMSNVIVEEAYIRDVLEADPDAEKLEKAD